MKISQVKNSQDGGFIWIAILLFYGKMEKYVLETALAAIKDTKRDNLMQRNLKLKKHYLQSAMNVQNVWNRSTKRLLKTSHFLEILQTVYYRSCIKKLLSMLFSFIFGVITEKLVGKTFKITMPRLLPSIS